MSDCLGDLPVSAKVDRDMKDWLAAEADRLGITRAELMRRMMQLYRESRNEQVDCPHCGKTVKMDVRE
jgi:hypothetical protein